MGISFLFPLLGLIALAALPSLDDVRHRRYAPRRHSALGVLLRRRGGAVASQTREHVEQSPGGPPIGAPADAGHTGSPQDIEQMTKKCPECAETIKAETIKFEAIVCRYCHYRFDPADVARTVEQQRQIRATEPKQQIRRWKCPRCSKIVEGPTCACGWGY